MSRSDQLPFKGLNAGPAPKFASRRMRATSGLAALLIREAVACGHAFPARRRLGPVRWLGSQIAITLAAAALIVVAAFARPAVLTAAAGQDEIRARARRTLGPHPAPGFVESSSDASSARFHASRHLRRRAA
jgi:hypothetical protein